MNRPRLIRVLEALGRFVFAPDQLIDWQAFDEYLERTAAQEAAAEAAA